MKTDLIESYYETGKKDIYWYPICRDNFIKIFGIDRLPLVCNLFAATSINTSLKANICLFRKALYEIENGLPVGSYLPNIKSSIELIRAGKELNGRKISNFSRCMQGQYDNVVVDVWITRAFQLDNLKRLSNGRQVNRSPSKKEYDLIESWIKYTAKEKRMPAAFLCSAIWSGVRMKISGDRTTQYKELLESKFTNLFNVI